MKFSEDVKKSIISGFMEILTWIASKEYQKRVWISAVGPEVNDFDETCNNFYGSCEAILHHYKDLGITDSQYQLVLKFRDVFQQFSDENDWPPFFIDTPEWNKINEMAEEVLQAFNYKGRLR